MVVAMGYSTISLAKGAHKGDRHSTISVTQGAHKGDRSDPFFVILAQMGCSHFYFDYLLYCLKNAPC